MRHVLYAVGVALLCLGLAIAGPSAAQATAGAPAVSGTV